MEGEGDDYALWQTVHPYLHPINCVSTRGFLFKKKPRNSPNITCLQFLGETLLFSDKEDSLRKLV